MTDAAPPDRARLLRQWMQRVGLSSLRQLSRAAGVSERQLHYLRRGEIARMRLGTLQNLAQALQVSVAELLAHFDPSGDPNREQAALAALRQECQRLQQQQAHQQQQQWAQWQRDSLGILEPWLLQWPTAAEQAQANPELPAYKLVPLVEPVERLLEHWGIRPIGAVGQAVAYDPQWHQLLDGAAEPGDRVCVRYVGYCQGDRLLYRAQVSPNP
ncbi:MAG: hypothetical protein BRC58_08070 [Cyanobacteria bacterium QS_8_64_29]|nr:MAG: hypothetical protein BRC58_08070 [Cyanobacteria bacterium QS_8_64_29]